ncbi:hypothetical protein [Patulibacter defluvii]|uniref:hypothetical protein n=1 Tax=Patulibacter defluvii TaxID=3095358 RepID=UPI002A7614DC|nr:hypothetical protein [Patulibacter sp. DM4]
MPVNRLGARATAIGAAALLGLAASASTAMAGGDPPPSFARCPTGNPDVLSCMVIQSTGGYLRMNNTTVDLGDSIKIEAGLSQDANYNVTVVPPTSGSALTAKPIKIPGGLLGLDASIFGANDVYATAKLVGTPVLNFDTYSLKLPIKIELDNAFVGPNCQIGSESNPIILDTITGTTNPPPPATPMTGHPGDIQFPDPYVTEVQGNVTVDNAFAVGEANNCGWFGGYFINPLVNLKVGLPSAAGKNATSVTANIFLKAASDVVAGN